MLVAAIVLFLLVGVVAFSFGLYLSVFHSPHKGQNSVYNMLTGDDYSAQLPQMYRLLDEFVAVPFQTVQVRSFDGLKLIGHYYHVSDDAPLVICFHGYRGTATRDYCCCGNMLLGSGANLLVVEQRAHGESGGHTITFGEKERLDCLTWTRYAVERFGPDVRIVLHGISMGATTVLLAAELDLPANVCGIIADCPYTSPKAILTKVCRDKKVSPALSYPFLWLGAVMFGHFNPSAHSAVRSVTHSRVPVLLVHGERDKIVPLAMSRQIYSANPSAVRLEIFDDAPHGTSVIANPTRYEQAVRQFLQNVSIAPHAVYFEGQPRQAVAEN